jgi:hypothetical protein
MLAMRQSASATVVIFLLLDRQHRQDRELNSPEDEFGTTREVQNYFNDIDIVTKETRPKGNTRKNLTSRPTISPSLWLLLLFFSSVHGITYNCINKNTPSSSCCSGEITLDPTMTTIAANAFDGCSNLIGTLTIPSSVTTIGSTAFRGCSGFTEPLVIPSSVTSIAGSAFHSCAGFQEMSEWIQSLQTEIAEARKSDKELTSRRE